MNQLGAPGDPFTEGTGGCPATAAPWARPRGVLIVDDDEDVRRVLAAGLWYHGFAVWVAADGGEAVAVYRSFRPSIDVVLLDVLMPGCDGPETLAALREYDPDVRACFMTAYAGRYSEQELLAFGTLAVLRKPFGLDDLAGQLTALTAPADNPDGLQEAR
jgi:CheY-like chemotaxis protein